MKVNNQQGFVTLLITSVLLLCALIVTLGNYRSVFHQIKVAQNEVEGRKKHWKAEGGLECGFTQIKGKFLALPTSGRITVNGCTSEVIITKNLGGNYLVSSNVSNMVIEKTILASGAGLGATIKTTAAIELTGSMHFVPMPIGDINNSECSSIISGKTVSYIASISGLDEHFLTVDKTDSAHASGILGAPSFKCKTSYKSNLFDTDRKPEHLGEVVSPVKGLDIKENIAGISVFNDLFGMPYNKLNVDQLREEIRSDNKGFVLDRTAPHSPEGWIHGCSDKIKNAYINGKRRFWIEGSCAISGNVFGSSTQPVSNSSQLIVHDGVIYTKAMGYFDGLIYQYVPESLDTNNVWVDLFTSSTEIGVIPDSFLKHNAVAGDIDNYTFLLDGSMKLDGGIGLDAADRTIRLNGSLIPAYNGEKSSKYISQLKWKKGSWNDL